MDKQRDIFEGQENPASQPLAEKYRPVVIEEVFGQDNIIGENTLLRSMLETENYRSFIMWGPPGSGKTTIARIIERKKRAFVFFSAVLAGIKEVKEVMQEAEYTYRIQKEATILFIDEIHRFNRAQQDAFLPYVESGSIILIGATTENPSFNIIPALLSRCHVFVLNMLGQKELVLIVQRVLEKENKLDRFEEEAIDYLAMISGGDARRVLLYLELVIGQNTQGELISIKTIKKILQKKTLFYDRKGEEHYNLISAFHKSIRGSDPQACLYWLARMLEAGEDPLFLARRLIRMASEDIGLADPNALVQAVAAKEAVHFLGMPEANNALAQAAVYMATAPKSNAIYKAYNAAAADALKTGHYGVPLHIRNAPTKLMSDLEYGKEYKYDHDYENHYYYQKYFPELMEEQVYYEPTEYGFEKDIQKRIDWWKRLRAKQEKEPIE